MIINKEIFPMSNKKNLLEENTVRRFMKLAGTQPLASDFFKETTLTEAPEDELEMGEEVEVEEELPEEPEGLELDAEEGGEDPDAEEGSVEAFAKDALEAIAGVAKEHGVDIDVEEAPEPEEVEVGEMEIEEDDMEGELGPEDEEVEVEGEDDEAALEALQEITYIDEDVLMETVYKRVANRLMREKRADDVADKLARKLASRVSKKLR